MAELNMLDKVNEVCKVKKTDSFNHLINWVSSTR